ncbi:hypothetical protein MKX01_030528 [Papaver californicum]|nr:hypothetical protein MKX01_030528 [Papaver californicum]
MMCLLSIVQEKEISYSRFDFKKLSDDDSIKFNVMIFDAVGNGIADDSKAFLSAWIYMCKSTTGIIATLIIPQGKTFLLSYNIEHINFQFQVDGKIIAPVKGSWVGKADRWIQFTNLNHLAIIGSGEIKGQGSTWWDLPDQIRPSALTLANCNGCQLRGLMHVNGQRNHINISGSHELVISHVNIIAPENSHNTDGIDISFSKSIRIQDFFIGTGDHCVAINGRCKLINITNVNCGPGHDIRLCWKLIAKGSEQTVEDVHVQNVHFQRILNGARIKTWEVSITTPFTMILFDQITIVDIYNPIGIEYDVVFGGIRGTSTNATVVNLNCSRVIPCTNIVMSNIGIQSTRPGKKVSSYCVNAHGTVTETSPNVPCLA